MGTGTGRYLHICYLYKGSKTNVQATPKLDGRGNIIGYEPLNDNHDAYIHLDFRYLHRAGHSSEGSPRTLY